MINDSGKGIGGSTISIPSYTAILPRASKCPSDKASNMLFFRSAVPFRATKKGNPNGLPL